MFAIMGGAAALPFLSRRIRVPSAVLEIIYGMVLFGMVVSTVPDWLPLLKELGFVYLMFIAGMELDLGSFARGRTLAIYVLVCLVPFVLMPLVAVRIGLPFFFGIAVSVLSVGIVLPVLKEEQLIQTDLGREIMGIALAGELVSIAVLTGIDIFQSHGVSLMAAWAGIKLLALFFFAALFLKLLYLMAWWNPQRVEKVMESEDPVEEGLRAVITVAFLGALIAYGAGVEPILGSFMSGLIFSYVFKARGRFEDKINAAGFGFFIPLFFIGVGAGFDISLFRSAGSILSCLLLAGMVLLSNVLPLLLSPLLKFSFRDSFCVSLLLSAPLSMMVIAADLGRRMELIDDEMKGMLILAAIISGILYPYLFRLIVKRQRSSAQGRPSGRGAVSLKDPSRQPAD